MREIKFRAWEPKYKYMTSCVSFQEISEWFKWLNGSVVMQFTWLKDKNGKEIYEGDICYKEGYWKNCIIRWNKEWLRYEAFYWISDNLSDKTISLWFWKQHLCHICDKCESKIDKMEVTETVFWNTLEIIGNIYKNPELLQSKL